MKKNIVTIVCTLMLLATNNAFSDNEVKIDFSTEIKNSDSVYLLVNVKDVKNLYATSIDFNYNPKDIRVKSIEGGDMIKNNDKTAIELGGETKKEGNIANYQFTFTGKVKGLNGSGNICKIEIEYLNDNKIEINDSNMKIKLAGIDNNYEVKEISYNLVNTSIQRGEEALTKEQSSSSEKVEPVIGTIGKNELNSNRNEDIKLESNAKDEVSSEEQNIKEDSIKEELESSKESSSTMISDKNNFNYLIVVIGLVLIFGGVFLLNKKKNN